MPLVRAEAVAVYVFRRAPELEFLQLRRASADDNYPATWQTVYGALEAGETAVEAALRELTEETSLRPRTLFQVEFLESFYFKPTDHITMMPVFGAEVDVAAEPTLDAEHDAWRWVATFDCDRQFMWRSQREAIRVILDQLERGGLAHEMLTIELPTR